MSEKKTVSTAVVDLVEELKKNGSSRFSKSDYQTLIYGILSDKDFKTKKFLIKNDAILEEEYSINEGMTKFLDKLLKHAGVAKPEERENIIETFTYGPKDVEWVADCVDNAMHIYTECNKSMRLFRDQMLQLTVKKIIRTGAKAGMVSYRKSVQDRAVSLQRKLAKK